MLTDPLAITYNAVVKNLVRVNQDGYGSTYFLDDSVNLMRFTAEVKHTLPSAKNPGESHLIKLQVEFMDALGAIIRTVTHWVAMRTDGAAQDLVSSQRVQAALLTAAIPANTNKMFGRES